MRLLYMVYMQQHVSFAVQAKHADGLERGGQAFCMLSEEHRDTSGASTIWCAGLRNVIRGSAHEQRLHAERCHVLCLCFARICDLCPWTLAPGTLLYSPRSLIIHQAP